MLALDAERIDGQHLSLAHDPTALLHRPEIDVGGADALHQHPTDAVRNLAERLQRVVRLLQAVLVVDVEVARHRLVVGIARMHRMVVGERKEIAKEFLNHRFQLVVVQWLLR